MSMFVTMGSRRRRLIMGACVLALILAAVAWVRGGDHTVIRAQFVSADGLHVSDDVRVLGVKVGTITDIRNDGAVVVVTMQVDASQPIPADAKAAIVSPSLVSGRFVQLSPVWTHGDRLASGSVIDLERTAVPLSFDDVKQQLTDLATTLGPPDGKRQGVLADAITSMERSLSRGNSRRLRAAISELRGAAEALSDGRADIFSTVKNLDAFTRNLALNDAAVRGFTTNLDTVSSTLAANRTTLRDAVRGLAEVLDVTRKYLGRHHREITGSLREFNLLAAALADRSNELAGVLHAAPHSLIGLHNVVENGAITSQPKGTNFESAGQLICGTLLGIGGTTEQCRAALAPLLDLLGLRPGDRR